MEFPVAGNPRVASLRVAHPPFHFNQETLAQAAQDRLLGSGWRDRAELADRGAQIARLFEAARVKERQCVVDLPKLYQRTPTTGERMRIYEEHAGALALEAANGCAEETFTGGAKARISDLVVVSCTGYSAPGVDVRLARDLALDASVTRTSIGHMGCFAALVGLRQAALAVRATPGARALLVSVELCSLHFAPSVDLETLTTFALFGDAAAALTLTNDASATGPEVVDAGTFSDYAAAEQMSWRIGDAGFIMGLSPRVPVTLRRHVGEAVERLLSPHGLTGRDVAHWVTHPGGPSILQAVQAKLELSDEQMAPSWKVLREHGNCSSATVLLILDELMRSGRARSGEWCVMMGFGPGLTIEMALLRF
jgi:predicted naringenin-chalcone synthase